MVSTPLAAMLVIRLGEGMEAMELSRLSNKLGVEGVNVDVFINA